MQNFLKTIYIELRNIMEKGSIWPTKIDLNGEVIPKPISEWDNK